jgi:hypothetical protein
MPIIPGRSQSRKSLERTRTTAFCHTVFGEISIEGDGA